MSGVPIEVAAADTHGGGCTLAHGGKRMRNSVDNQGNGLQYAPDRTLIVGKRWRANSRVWWRVL